MMNESDSSTSSTNRLRRRSFVEHIEVDGNSHTTSGTTTSHLDVFSAAVEYHTATNASSINNSSTNSKKWLERIKNWLQYQIRRLRHGRSTSSSIGGLSSSPYGNASPSVEIQWRYPIGWITFGYVSLICIQLICFLYFQIDLKQLQVEECIYQKPLLLSSPNEMNTNEMNGLTKEAFINLQRRFAQLTRRHRRHHHPSLAIPPGQNKKESESESESEEDCMHVFTSTMEAGNKFQMFLPHSQVMLFPLNKTMDDNRKSKFQLYLFTQEEENMYIPQYEQAVQSALIGSSWSNFQKQLKKSHFPSLILVKNQFTLKKVWKYRQEQQDQLSIQQQEEQEDSPLRPPLPLPLPIVTKDDHDMLQNAKFSIFLLKTSVPDIYDRLLQKEWHSFLHIVQLTEKEEPTSQQYTLELLQFWLHHPHWPKLYVRFGSTSTTSSTILCQSFLIFLRQQQQTEGGRHQKIPSNVDIACEASQNTPSMLLHFKNRIGIHLFPISPIEEDTKQEKILQTLSAGAIAMTFHSPLMHEWVPDGTGIRLGSFEEKDNLINVQVTSKQIEEGIERLIATSLHIKVAMGRMARKHYLSLRTHYLTALAALDHAICGSSSSSNSPSPIQPQQQQQQQQDEQQGLQGQQQQQVASEEEEIDLTPLQVFLY